METKLKADESRIYAAAGKPPLFTLWIDKAQILALVFAAAVAGFVFYKIL